MGHARVLPRPATPFRLTLTSTPSLMRGCGRPRWRAACGSGCSTCSWVTRARQYPRSPSSWRSARRPCGGRCGGCEPVGWTRWRIGPGLAAHPGSASATSAWSRSCYARPPCMGRCGRRVSWSCGWLAAVACRSAQGGWARCCGRGAAAGHRPHPARGSRTRARPGPHTKSCCCGQQSLQACTHDPSPMPHVHRRQRLSKTRSR